MKFKYSWTAWGGDDFGLERDYKTAEEAIKVYDSIVDFTTKKQLVDLGFYGA